MTLRPTTTPQCVPLPSPPASSLPNGPDPEYDSLRAASPTVTRFLATAVTGPSFESTAASALVAGLDRQEEFECFAAAVPHLVSLLLPPEGDPDAPDIPTPRSYAEAIEVPYSAQWQAAMDAEMASSKSTGTYVDEVPPPGANIVSGMWIFRGVEFIHNFSPTPKMTSLRVLLHVAAHRDYELHSLDFSTAFLQGSLHKEIWLRRPPGFTGSFHAGTQWSLRRPVYGLRQAPCEWHDTLRMTLAALGFAPSTSDPSLFLRTDTTLPPFYILVYIDDLVFATADTEALAHVKSELQKRHTCTDSGELTSYLGLRITRDRAQRTITLTQSHMVQQVLQRFGFTYSLPQSTPLPTGHSLSAPPSDESVEPSGPYPELVGCLMYLMTCTRPDLAYPLSLLAHYVAPGRHRNVHKDAAKRVLRYLCSMSGMGPVLGGRARVVLTGHANTSWVDDLATQRSSQGYTFSLGSTSVSWQSTRSSSVLSSSCEAEIYAGAMAAQELCWLTYLLTDLGEAPHSPPVLYVDNKAMLALCQELRLEHRTKHIALRYFLAPELQQRGQLHLAYVASQANTADVFTKALQPCDHQPCVAFLDWSCDLLFLLHFAYGDEEISGVTKDGGEPEVEEQQQQQDAPPRTQRPPDRPRRDVRPPNRLTYPSFGKPKVVRAGSVAEQCDEDEIAHCYWAAVSEPKTLAEALSGPDAEKWKQSVKEEYDSLLENETWELCELPPGKKAISSKLIFRHKLKKAIYGLKQAPRAWYHKLEETLLAGGFKKSECDHSLFLLQEKEQFLMLLVYVDDILLLSESSTMIEHVEEMLEMQFKCSKMGDVKYYLGMHVERDLDKGELRLHQRKYCEGLAENYGLQDGGKPATPLPSGFTVEPCAHEEVVGESDRKLFHSMVGALNYAANHTRPDIAFATSRLASVVSCPSHEQLEAAKRLVCYVSATASVGLEYSAMRQRQQRVAADLGKGEMLLTCYTDASFNSVKADGTSIGGYVCLFGGGAVSWRNKKQNEVGLSSCETEYMVLHHGVKEVVWLRRLLEEIGVCQREPTVMFCDNESAVKLAKNACLHGLTKHIRPKLHWVRRLLDKEVRLEIVKTYQQAADILTKRLAEPEHWKGMKLAGMSVH
ncbi:unnamed protein product [Closterium sp. NIES-53]